MSKRTVKIVMALIAAALVAILIIGVNFAPHKTPGQRLGTEAVRILEKYKRNDLDAETASKIISGLMEKVLALEEAETDAAKKPNLTALWLDLLYIYNKLGVNGSATTYEIDEAEERIRKHL